MTTHIDHRRAWIRVWHDLPSMTRLAAPLAAAQVGQLAINTTDVLMLGWLGTEALAASAITMAVFVPLLLLGIGTITASASLIAEAIGQRDLRTVRRSVRQACWAAVMLSIPSMFVLIQIEAILLFFGQDPGITALAGDYMDGLVWSLLPAVLFVAFKGYVTAYERTRAILLITGCSIILNAIVNYLLIFGAWGFPALGVFGAGVGSTISNLSSLLALILYCLLARPFRRHVILGRFWRPDWAMLRKTFTLGLPIGLSIVLETSVFGASSILMGWIGTLELAAHQIALQIASITFMIPLGISQAATIKVGQAFGRRDKAKTRLSGFSAILLSAMFMGLAGFIIVTWPATLAQPFLDGSDRSIIVKQFAVSFLFVAAAFQIVDGIQVTAMGALRGVQDTHRPMWIAAIGYWIVGFPTAALLGFFTPLGGIGIWIGLAAGLFFVSVLLTARFAKLTQEKDLGKDVPVAR